MRYVPETYKNLNSVMNPELQHEFDQFCFAMTSRFSNYTDFAQPAEFWKNYKQAKTNSKPKPKRRRLNEEGDVADDDDQSTSGDSDSDSELPLDRHTLTSSAHGGRQRRGGLDVLATELIFQQHDW